jgi:hypothetical protein
MKLCTLLVALTTVAGLGTPGAATAAVAPADDSTPVVVGERRFTSAELGSAARRHNGDLRAAAYDLIHAEWIAREAAARGLVAPPELIDAAAAADRAVVGSRFGSPAYDDYLARIPATTEERRAAIAAGILEELVIDAITREAGPDPQAFALAFRQLAAGGRAVTTCLAAYAPEGRNACSNNASDARKRCVQVGIDDVCAYSADGRYRASWGGHPDLIIAFLDAPKASEAAVDPDGDRALARLRRYLRAHHPQALRRCDFDADDLAHFNCPTRADATAILYAATRIHQAAKRTWSAPATAGVVS